MRNCRRQQILFHGEKIAYNPDLTEIDVAMMFGFVKREGAVVVLANRMIETYLYNRFTKNYLYLMPKML